MSLSLKSFRLLGDPARVRLLLLLEREELSVAELQEILARGQSQISTHLSQLKQAGLVEDRRTGKNIFYRLKAAAGAEGKVLAQVLAVLRRAVTDIPEAERDQAALKLAIGKRRDRMRNYFDSLAGKFGREYLPGRSWEGLAEVLLRLMPPLVIADLGAGEGTFSQLLALRAKEVIAIDNSEKMIRFGRKLARTHRLRNLKFRLGDLEAVPLDDGAVDLAFFSQSLHHAVHPEKAVEEAFRIVKPGGRIVILDLLRHHFEEAREMYADIWLGFTELELRNFLKKGGFRNVRTAVVHRETDPPHFATVSALADKGG
jgi:ubiquinone/menaquinone biosynthesis C-methylase UbiE/DNA-binding transcriptional ArsR family regulator